VERLKLGVVAGVAQLIQAFPEKAGLELLSALRANLV
jgi:hypothetical protein